MSKRQKKKSSKYFNKTKKPSSVITSKVHIGLMDINPSGNGYFICEDLEKDVFIRQKDLKTAQNKDKVEVEVFFVRGKTKLRGKVSKILKRYKNIFTATVGKISETDIKLKPTDRKIFKEITAPINDFKKLKIGDKIVVEILKWRENEHLNEGRIIDFLGVHGQNSTEIKAMLVENGLPYDFPKEVEDFAANIDANISNHELKKRKDFRSVLTMTIDPDDAKDFDDALSFEVISKEVFRIGIHIADVSHYLEEGTILDHEAFQRATSVYLVDRVVPMLPEVLSNNLCSLRPMEDKCTFSAVFDVNGEGKILDKWFGKTIICSDQRFSYQEAQHLIDTRQKNIPSDISLSSKAYKVSDDALHAVLTLNSLAKKMRKSRMQNGAVSFDKVEVKFLLDKKSNPTGVYFKETKEANHLIEEFMLLANRSVAEFIGKEHKKLCVYRIHDEPDMDKLESLGILASKFGHHLNLKSKKQVSKSLNTLLENVKGKKEQNLLDTLAIRTMSKAEYSVHNIGHYGLAFEYYTHFTSPIRRYPDVMIHRMLQAILDEKPISNQEMDSYEQNCKHCSQMESLAVNTERNSVKYMQIRFLEIHKKDDYVGIISGVTERGIYVEIIENKCEGLIRLKDIETDYFYFDAKSYRIVGRRHGKIYQLGDQVKIGIKSLDVEKRHINFFLISE